MVLNYDDLTVRSFAEGVKAKIVWVSTVERVNGAYFSGGDLYYGEEKILSADEMLVTGVHNIYNALFAVACAKLLGVSTENIALSLRSFKGIKHRVETVACVDGVTYVDDSKGTNVDATLKAVANMSSETILLLGGKDKGYEYTRLFSALKGGVVKTVILYGENRYKLLSAAGENRIDHIFVCPTFYEAVTLSGQISRSGQTVLLSPASASFDEFSGYEERGDCFVEIVRGFEGCRGHEALDESVEQQLIKDSE